MIGTRKHTLLTSVPTPTQPQPVIENMALFSNATASRTRIELPPAVLLNNKSFSVEMYLKLLSTSTADQAILAVNFSGSSSSETNNKLHLLIRQRKPFFGAWFSDLSSTQIVPVDWFSLIFTYNASTGFRKIYINTLEVASQSGFIPYEGTRPLTIGQFAASSSTHLSAHSKFFRVWYKELSVAEIQQNHSKRIFNPVNGLAVNYNFNNDTLDSSGNNNHGTPFNLSFVPVN